MPGEEKHAANALEALQAVPLMERVRLVADDVKSKRDRFRLIDPHDLAEVLGIEDSYDPGSSRTNWQRIDYTPWITAEDLVETQGLSWLDIRNHLPSSIIEAVEASGTDPDENPDVWIARLSVADREALERHFTEREHANGMCLYIVRTNVTGSGGQVLQFEGDLEDDGTCIDLSTPYDFRDGNTVNLQECVWSY